MTVMVVTPEILYVGTDEFPTPAGLLTDWLWMADLLEESPRVNTLIVTGHYQNDVKDLSDRWELGEMGETGWMSLRAKRSRRPRYVWLGFTGEMGADQMLGMVRNNPWKMVMRLDAWRRAIGSEYRVSPAVSAITSMRDMGKRLRNQPRWILQDLRTAEWWQPPGNIRALSYDGRTAPVPLHHYDRRAAYLADAGTTYFPCRQLQPTGSDPLTFGYFLIRTQPHRMWEPFGPTDHLGRRLVGHSTMETIRRYQIWHEVTDSWTTDDASRYLRPWSERWREAIDEMPQAREFLKAGYAQGFGGLLGVPRGTIYRPDWRHLGMDACNAHVLRAIMIVWTATGQWPSRVDVDSLYYLTDVSAYLPLGEKIGNFQYKGIKP